MKNMKYDVIGLVTLAGSFLFTNVAIADQYTDSIKVQLMAIALEVLGGNYQPTHEPIIDELNDNEVDYHYLSLEEGVEYGIVAVCDQDCTDVDLWLYDENNNLIDEDTDTDDYPLVTVSPQWTGDFKVKVKMYDCDASYCNYGVAIFGR